MRGPASLAARCMPITAETGNGCAMRCLPCLGGAQGVSWSTAVQHQLCLIDRMSLSVAGLGPRGPAACLAAQAGEPPWCGQAGQGPQQGQGHGREQLQGAAGLVASRSARQYAHCATECFRDRLLGERRHRQPPSAGCAHATKARRRRGAHSRAAGAPRAGRDRRAAAPGHQRQHGVFGIVQLQLVRRARVHALLWLRLQRVHRRAPAAPPPSAAQAGALRLARPPPACAAAAPQRTACVVARCWDRVRAGHRQAHSFCL